MEYSFGCNFPGDIIIGTNEETHNLGYNYTLNLPIILWLHNVQCEGINIFQQYTPQNEQISYELEELVQQITEFSSKFPLSTKDFNQQLCVYNLDHFSNGSHTKFYEFSLEENKTLKLSKKIAGETQPTTILGLSPTDSIKLAESYIAFSQKEDRLGRYQIEITQIARELSKLKI